MTAAATSSSSSSNKALLIPVFLAGAGAAGSVLWSVLYCYQRQQRQQQQKNKSHDDHAVQLCYKNDQQQLIYMDYNGTTPVYPEVVDAMMPYFRQHYGNPNSSHAAGDAPRAAVNAARRQILTHVLGYGSYHHHDPQHSNSSDNDDDRLLLASCVFTSCGTEADNLAIHLALERHHYGISSIGNAQLPPSASSRAPVLPHVVTCNVEHAAVDGCLAVHERAGRCTVTRVPVQKDGRVAARDVIAAIRPNST